MDELFWAKVIKTDSCWEWAGSCLPDGHGRLGRNGKLVLAHRFAYEQCIGPIPEGKLVGHTCWNPRCVNPDHLFAASRKELMGRLGKERGAVNAPRPDVGILPKYEKSRIADPVARFWSKVAKSEGCWQWTATTYGRGYGMCSWYGKQIGAHRIAYELEVGPIPEGMCVCHRCDNPSCVRPDHLFLGSHLENMRDKANKNRAPRLKGELSGSAKLSAELVQEIRHAFEVGEPTKSIAQRMNISVSTVQNIRKGKTWAHVR